jgi:hypothetical protein
MRALVLVAALAASPAAAQTLMTCEVIGTSGSGENAQILYNENNCRPVTSAEVLGSTGTGSGSSTVYGSRQQPTLGGGPVYILRFGEDRGRAHYGPPLDGNPGTVGR